MNFVWVYWEGGADSDELRYSIRSTIENVSGITGIAICGDKPNWFIGHHIYSPRVTKSYCIKHYGSSSNRKWIDSIVKLQRIVSCKLIDEEFTWMYDDTFFSQKINALDLKNARYSGQLKGRQSGRNWRKVMGRTRLELESRGLPTRNFSNHCPMVFEKQKLLHLISEFNLPENPRLIESLYFNYFKAQSTKNDSSFFRYTKKPKEGFRLGDEKIRNVGSFNQHCRAEIKKRFRNPTGFEI